jgi:hypothetical protein
MRALRRSWPSGAADIGRESCFGQLVLPAASHRLGTLARPDGDANLAAKRRRGHWGHWGGGVDCFSCFASGVAAVVWGWLA